MNEQKTTRKPHISPERRDRFTWHVGDLKFFESREELERHAEKHGETITWYGENNPSKDAP